LINHGGPVQAAARVYVDFWGWQSDPSGEQPYLTRFLSSVGGTSWLATVDQYGAGSPASLLAGTWSDPATVPASPTDAQIQAEAVAAATHFAVGTSVDVQIVVATPSGHSTPGFITDFCAYHNPVAAQPNITYTDFPYTTDAGASCGEDSVNGSGGTLDGVSIVEGHELAESITDPLLTTWYDAGYNEIGDKCAYVGLADIPMPGGAFPVQTLWSNAANGCVLSSNGPGRTSPSITTLPGGGEEAALQASNGILDTLSVPGGALFSSGTPMAPGTSPSIVALPSGAQSVAFQASNGILDTLNAGGVIYVSGLPMAPGTSPSITQLPNNAGQEVAFQASNGTLNALGPYGALFSSDVAM
jgi:serine protease